MADPRKDLEKFLRQQLFRRREQPLISFSLRSAGVGARGTPVDTFDIPAELDGDGVPMLADEIMMRAQADADGMGTKLQRYTLTALEVGKKDGPRFPFRLRGEGEEDGDGDGEEPATEKGLLAQLMRHNEHQARTNAMMMSSVIGVLSSRLNASEKHVEVLIQQRQDYFKELEDAKSLQHDRDMQLMLTTGQEERKGELFKKLELILPLIVNKVAGRKVLPEGAGGDIFTTLANSLSPDQLQQIAPFLTQEQQLLLLTLIKEAREKGQPNGVS